MSSYCAGCKEKRVVPIGTKRGVAYPVEEAQDVPCIKYPCGRVKRLEVRARAAATVRGRQRAEGDSSITNSADPSELAGAGAFDN